MKIFEKWKYLKNENIWIKNENIERKKWTNWKMKILKNTFFFFNIFFQNQKVAFFQNLTYVQLVYSLEPDGDRFIWERQPTQSTHPVKTSLACQTNWRQTEYKTLDLSH